MHPKALLIVCYVLGGIGTIAIAGFVFGWTPWQETGPGLFWIIAAVFMGLPWLLVRLIPVRCPKPGCNAPMRRDWVAEGWFKKSLMYVCTRCGEVYDMNMTSEWGGDSY